MEREERGKSVPEKPKREKAKVSWPGNPTVGLTLLGKAHFTYRVTSEAHLMAHPLDSAELYSCLRARCKFNLDQTDAAPKGDIESAFTQQLRRDIAYAIVRYTVREDRFTCIYLCVCMYVRVCGV